MQQYAAAATLASNDPEFFSHEYRATCLKITRTGIDDIRGAPPEKLFLNSLPEYGEGELHVFASGPMSGQAGRGIRDEMPYALRAYDELLAAVCRIMDSAGNGKPRAENMDIAVFGAIQSLERNPDALLCIPRIRRGDNYTYTHCANVAVLLASFALRSGAGGKQVVAYALAGLLHDLGMALLPVALLNAKRKLSDTEKTLVRRHPKLGCDLMSSIGTVHDEIARAAFEHHERYNGSGYPRGLSGDAISVMGHIAGIADTYDALSSRRPYKGALFPHRTLGIMYQMRKKQFHPVILEKFVRLVGIYPVGSVVELQDGYRGVVTGSNYANPIQPVVTLALDPDGHAMCLHECDLAKDGVAGIARCLPPETSGIDPGRVLGIAL
ncbi:MAG: HD-GYP domain-containing protein [Desulfovibrio sp.]|jgi:HD-GYP domain-containing protein (c-di-GMP phosphodiesterase class II)|nr:HD-GYP domain-containing protein [Desulfovibrio sp.]